MESKCIVVTGGAGFVGSHLCEALVAQGHRVISLDNYFMGSRDNHVAGVEYREGHTKDIAQHIPEKPDLIYHLGEYSRVAQSLEEPGLVFDLNITGTCGVLEFWRKHCCKLVYAGSSTKYADPRADGIEGRNLSPYTWAKAINTDLVEQYANWYKLPFATVYFSNVYGPRERADAYGTVIEIFKQRFLHGEPLEVRLPGTQSRNYTHVADTISALLLVGEKGQGDGYTIAADMSYPILEVAKLFGGQITMLPERKTSRPSTELDTRRMKELGWSAKHSLKEYIADIVKQRG